MSNETMEAAERKPRASYLDLLLKREASLKTKNRHRTMLFDLSTDCATRGSSVTSKCSAMKASRVYAKPLQRAHSDDTASLPVLKRPRQDDVSPASMAGGVRHPAARAGVDEAEGGGSMGASWLLDVDALLGVALEGGEGSNPEEKAQRGRNAVLRRHLFTMLHGARHHPPAQSGEPAGSLEPCELRNCAILRSVLMHIREGCTEAQCRVVHCTSSKGIIRHWEHCTRPDCRVCVPVRELIEHDLPDARLNGTSPQCSRLNGAVQPNRVGVSTEKLQYSLNDANQQKHSLNKGVRQNYPPVSRNSSVFGTEERDIPTNQRSFTTNVADHRNLSMNNGMLTSNSAALRNVSDLRNINLLSRGGPPNERLESSHSTTSVIRSNVISSTDKCGRVEEFLSGNGAGAAHIDLSNNCAAINSRVSSSVRVPSSSPGPWVPPRVRHPQGDSIRRDTTPPSNGVYRSTTPLPSNNLMTSQLHAARPQNLSQLQSGRRPIGGNTNTGLMTGGPQQILKNISNRDALLLRPGVEGVGGVGQTGSKVESVVAAPAPGVTETAYVGGVRVEASRLPGECIVWNAKQLSRALCPCLATIYKQSESMPFRLPVDPVALQCPDYYEIIQSPMDLSLIRRKLETCAYSDPWQMVDDCWLMFNNCWTYNRRSTKVFKDCTKLSRVFAGAMDPLMRALGYCCAASYTYSPVTLHCSGRTLCCIHAYEWYYSYDKYLLCEHCYLDGHSAEVTITDDSSKPIVVAKDVFKKMKNIEVEPEKLVMCEECGRRLHSVCVLHIDEIWAEGHVCRRCRTKQGARRPRPDNPFTAQNLPRTELGAELERRAREFLQLAPGGGVHLARRVHVRLLASARKCVEVKEGMRARFPDTPVEYHYVAKTIGVFLDVGPGVGAVGPGGGGERGEGEGGELCFFVMHVQEYGDDCPEPNHKRVYLAYMDSVNYFQPKHLRSALYHEVLVAYLAHLRRRGFASLHIWACPPCEGDDYIFNCHPPGQKVPRPKRLQAWYKQLLDKAVTEEAIHDYRDLYQDVMEAGLKSSAELPYFEGDFWTSTIEELVAATRPAASSLGAEEGTVAVATPSAGLSPAGESCEGVGENGLDAIEVDAPAQEVVQCVGSATSKKCNKRKGKKKKGAVVRSKGGKRRVGGAVGPLDLTEKLLQAIHRHREGFFVARLWEPAGSPPLLPDADPMMPNDLMDVRGNFLLMARDERCEFSSLRRALYSTMVLLYELHRELLPRGAVNPRVVPGGADTAAELGRRFLCASCGVSGEPCDVREGVGGEGMSGVRYKCNVCQDYDLCAECYNNHGHSHAMQRLCPPTLTDPTDDQDPCAPIAVTFGSLAPFGSTACQSGRIADSSQAQSGLLVSGKGAVSGQTAPGKGGCVQPVRRLYSHEAQRHAPAPHSASSHQGLRPPRGDPTAPHQRTLSLAHRIALLEHSSACASPALCAWPGCADFCAALRHARSCGACTVCTDQRVLVDSHARSCAAGGEGHCAVEGCAEARRRVLDTRRHRARAHDSAALRRMAMMDRGGEGGEGVGRRPSMEYDER